MKSIPEDSLLQHINSCNLPAQGADLVYECPVTGTRSWVKRERTNADYGWMYVVSAGRPPIKVSTRSLRQPVLFSEDQRDELAHLLARLVVPHLCSVTGKEKEEFGAEFCNYLQKNAAEALRTMLAEHMPVKDQKQ